MERRTKLDRGDYYELRTRIRDAELAEVEARQVRMKAQATFEALAKSHDLDPKLNYRWDDATYELIAADVAEKA